MNNLMWFFPHNNCVIALSILCGFMNDTLCWNRCLVVHDFGVIKMVTNTEYCLYRVEFANKR